MASTKAKKRKISQKIDSSSPTEVTKKTSTTQKLEPTPNSKSKAKVKINSSSPSASTSEYELERIQQILESCSKDQLIDLATDVAISSSTIYSKIREVADKDISHRKLFVHGLSWETTNETLVSVFEKFGEIENSNVVIDRATGKSKGYGFVTFKARKSARKALEQPRTEINNRVVVWQLASLGPAASNSGQHQDATGISGGTGNLSGRKIYVNNVGSDVSADKLRIFFSKFGELESGPMGFDVQTGKFKGYALFVYKSVEGAKKALEEPYKVFEGRQLHCQKATEGKKNTGGAASITTAVQSLPPVYAALGAQSMPLVGQNPGVDLNSGMFSVNPLYSSFLANPNVAALSLANMSSLGSLGQGGAGLGIASGYGAYGGFLGHGLSSLGTQNMGSMVGSYGNSVGMPMLQGLQYAYPKAEAGQMPSGAGFGSSGAGARSSY
ncbi:OLC1v1009111C1 [Oldenlandia corymbosa var. corymbosa]|uniref:OLC1v1009111C1 n=1 Tax=Oldenlandia corymbosa var. corymbosa TaxID=529605 RepID=A0AAV1DRC8_OLDCO|nr:OLC1v1009111C1 [Oldenlandia corymbosa var. corymbosa]